METPNHREDIEEMEETPEVDPLAVLADIVAVNKASQSMLELAADAVTDLKTAGMLRNMANQRARQVDELRDYVGKHAGEDIDPVEVEPMKAGVTQMHEAVEKKDLTQILTSALALEHALRGAYENARDKTAEYNVAGVLERHLRNAGTQASRLQRALQQET